ncbi:molybdopterin-guanine dinucleotide biosynthesis protein MobB [Sulfolobales archaeon HS-7]|nr:molybdopterin-guanine dinucleotide biosynthesis protein MobB [Sulfolobales archaeon HS-7]
MRCLIQITGESGSGKTYAAEILTRKLREMGKSVIYVKGSHHEASTLDKDTSRLLEAGAKASIFMGRNFAIFTKSLPDPEFIKYLPADVILIEGMTSLNLGRRIRANESEELLEELKECKYEPSVIVNNDTDPLIMGVLEMIMRVYKVSNVYLK